MAGASITWEAVGRNAVVVYGSAESDAKGLATAVWQLGTDAAETQELHALVRRGQSHAELTIRARAIPHVVAQLRVSVDTPGVMRLGDSLPIAVTAVDPFGNSFPAPSPILSASDTSIGRIKDQSVLAGPRRGRVLVTVASKGVTSSIPIDVVQYVAAIHPVIDTLYFTSLNAHRPIQYQLADDRGQSVTDTSASISISDTSVAQLTDSGVKALATGITTLHLAVGSVVATMAVNVQQRVASLTLVRDTIRFDALLDTTTIYPIARDSLGSPISHPALVFSVSDPGIASLEGERVVQARTPGVTLLTLADPSTGISVTAPLVVDQRTATIEVSPLVFDALADTLPIVAIARDRLGSLIPNPSLEYSVSDTTIANVVAGNRLRSIREGQFALTIRDGGTATSATMDVTVAQRVTALQLSRDTVTFDALTDSVPIAFTAWDRRGVLAGSAQIAYSSSNPSVVAVNGEGAMRSVGNGSALVIGQSPDGPADTVHVDVAQQVVRVELGADSLVFESLHAVQTPTARPVDRLGVRVTNASLSYAIEDPQVSAVGAGGDVSALANGTTGLLVTAGGQTSRVTIRVAQRPTNVRFSPDTVRFQAFGDSVTLGATALDSLGSPVTGGISGVAVSDPTIAAITESSTLHATGNGVTRATVAVAGITGQVVVDVDQVPTALSVSSTFGNPVITLPAGAPFPLTCQAADRNGYAIARDPVLVGSTNGTVAGSVCSDARVARSGYDTLVFALGAVRTRVPVIVATAPDSLGIVIAAQPSPNDERIQYRGEDVSNPSILALRPLVQEILAAYGNPSTDLGRARALRDWVARTAVHPHPPLHPDGSTSNLGVLPLGSSWADVNVLMALPSKDSMLNANVQFWQTVGYDGYAMLDRLLGTLDPTTGMRADDGMMEHVGGAWYRIRDLHSYKYPICTFQVIMLNALWAAAGLQGMLTPTIDHDPASVFIADLNQWVYEDPTFNEEYQLDGTGNPLSPIQLLEYSSSGNSGRLRSTKFTGPESDPEPYIATESYVGEHPNGMVIIGSQLNSRVVGIGGWSTRLVQIDVPQLGTAPLPYSNPLSYVPVTELQAFPILGPVLDQIESQDSVYVVHLSSTFPNSAHFERRLSGGQWEGISSVDVLPVGQCLVEYRSLDGMGNYSATTRLDVWLPRADDFVQLAPIGSTRSQSRLCERS